MKQRALRNLHHMENRAFDAEALSTEQLNALVLETAMEAGRILLENGAEIFRVEETIERIAIYFGVSHGDVYVLTNGIFCSGGSSIEEAYSRIMLVPVRGIRLDKVIAVNQLSREIEQGRYTLRAVHERLVEIDSMPAMKLPVTVAACGIGCGCFAVMFGGGVADGAAALLSGLLLQLFMLFAGNRMSKLVGNLFGAAVGTLVCLLLYTAGLGRQLSPMVIGTMMALIPGVPFTNGIRDIADSDYLSGMVRLLDALLVFAGIAMGMAAVFMLYHTLFGGALL